MGLALALSPPALAFDSLPESARDLIRRLDQVRTENNISALGLAVVDIQSDAVAFNFTTASGTYGHESDETVTPDTVFRLGSITKSFTALTLLRLQQAGTLRLEDRLSKYLPSDYWQNPWAAQAPITLAQLLEHSAGFGDISQAEWDSAVPLDLDDALRRYADRHQVQWRPGSYSSYTNLGAGLAGRAMEKATGRPYEELVRTELLQPLGMASSGFDADQVRVVGYDRDGTTVIHYWHVVYRPFGGLNASVNDMARYVRWHLQRGELDGENIISTDDMARAERDETTLAARGGLHFGNGLGNYPWLRDGVLFHGHGGDADGYLARFAYSHELGRGYFLVINAFNGRALGAMRRIIENELIGDHQARPAPPTVSLDPETYNWLEGRYRAQTRRFGWSGQGGETYLFRIRDDSIQYRDRRGWKSLKAVRAEADRVLLRYRSHNRPTAIILRSQDGIVHFVDDSLNLQRDPD